MGFNNNIGIYLILRKNLKFENENENDFYKTKVTNLILKYFLNN